MATLTKEMSKDEILHLKERLSKFILKESTPQYTYYQVKTKECTITAYTSGKVVFQGADLSWLELQPLIKKRKTRLEAMK